MMPEKSCIDLCIRRSSKYKRPISMHFSCKEYTYSKEQSILSKSITKKPSLSKSKKLLHLFMFVCTIDTGMNKICLQVYLNIVGGSPDKETNIINQDHSPGGIHCGE
jgi:hypothetical protein